jgi:hypothetical protein
VRRLCAAALGVMSTQVHSGAPPAAAGACGDDVAGERVACACGDNVVSDTVLWPADPVVSEPCSGDGLVVLVPTGSDGITLNLGGQSIVGTGRGAGIRVVHGGRLGSIIIGGDAEDARAEIVRFDTGILATGRNVLREVRAIDVHDNRDDGLKIRASGVRIEDVRSEGNGRNGLALSGHGIEVSGVVADGNIRDGLQVRGSGASVSGETTGNLRNGTVIGGRGHHVETIRSNDNGGAGVMATGAGHEVTEMQTSDNARGGVAGRDGATK